MDEDIGLTEEIEVVLGPEAHRGPQEPCMVGLKGENRGVLYRLPAGDTLVGRDKSLVQLVLSAPGVSRAHARFFHHPDGSVSLSDLGSTNGTFVNGERLEEERILVDGDTVSFGPNALMRLNFQDTVEQKLLTNLYDSATRDGLTGLLNKKSLMERLEELHFLCCQNATPASIAVLDGDRFKSVNDTYGHAAGDEVLKELARRFLEGTRETDIVARYGGEEFVIVLRDTDLDSALMVLEKVRSLVEARRFTIPLAEGGTADISVTVSAGVALVDPETSMESSLARADAALYRAKDEGRNRVVSA